MKDLDDRIKEALRREQGEMVGEDIPAANLYEMLSDAFHGRNRVFTFMAFVMTFVFLGLAAYCAREFFRTDDLKDAIAWAAGFGASLATILAMKIWFWLEMQRASVMREVKRVELQLLRLFETERE